MTQAKGSNVQLLLIEESTWGTTPGTPSAYKIPISGLTGDWGARNLIDNPTLRGNRNPAAPVRGNVSVTGGFGFPLSFSAFGWLQKHCIGVPATSGSGPYVHVSKSGFSGASAGDLPAGITFEHGYTDINQFHYFTGCRLDGFTVNGSSEGVASFDFNVIGQDFNQDTSSLDSSATEYTDSAIDHFSLAMSEGGSSIANVKEFSLTFSNNHDTSQYVIGSSGQLGSLPSGIVAATGSITALFEDDTLLTKARAFTESDLTATWTSGTYSLALHCPEIVYAVRHPSPSGPDGVVLTLDFQSYYADDTDACALMSTLTNNVATY